MVWFCNGYSLVSECALTAICIRKLDTKLPFSKTYVFVAVRNSVYCEYLGSKYLFMRHGRIKRLVLTTEVLAKVSLNLVKFSAS